MTQKNARTELFAQWMQGNMVIADEGESTGSRFWVSSGTGSDTAGHGKSPDAPFATLDYASAQCTASKGDIIYLMPGHAETIISATGCNLAVAGVRVKGLGSGANRPTFTFTTANAAVMTVDAANVSIENVVFVCGKDGQTIMLDINADDCAVRNCEFRNDATYQAVTMIDINGGAANAADRPKIIGCRFLSTTAGATQAIEVGDVEDSVVVEDCFIYGDWSAAGIHSASILTNLLLKGNVVANLQTGDHAIELSAAALGMLIDNRMYGDTLGTILDPGSCFCAGNLEVDAIDQAGVDSPRTSAGGFPDNSITAATIADDAIDSSGIAADAFNSSMFANDTFDSSHFAADAFDSTMYADEVAALMIKGVRVAKATASLPQNGTSTLFTVAGGNVVLTGIVGEVTTQVETKTNNAKLISTPTTGSAVDMCATLDITALETGAFLTITGTPANNMVKANAGSIALTATPVIVAPGTIGLNTDTTATGASKWWMWYVPLEDGASVS